MLSYCTLDLPNTTQLALHFLPTYSSALLFSAFGVVVSISFGQLVDNLPVDGDDIKTILLDSMLVWLWFLMWKLVGIVEAITRFVDYLHLLLGRRR